MSLTDLATPTGQAKITVQMLIAVLVALIMASLIAWGGIYIGGLKRDAAAGEQRKTTAITTEGIQSDGVAADTEAQHVDITVRTARDAYNQEKANVPLLVDRDTRAVPDSLRELARKRRLARERSGRAATEREKNGDADETAER